ncbi:MAG TPA: prolyl oligopeptidase family serine peptidase, partial [Brevundimonas sp.]|nr:prolyl oligopeptidase family serine peptidase [Brevundimonas sp.]
ERRSLWEAPDQYRAISPFTFADRIDEPILLMHGGADSNSGTLPMQSERFFAALKGHGATARYVLLPHEGHAYRARESLQHALWEITEWLNRHVRASEPPYGREPHLRDDTPG